MGKQLFHSLQERRQRSSRDSCDRSWPRSGKLTRIVRWVTMRSPATTLSSRVTALAACACRTRIAPWTR